MLIKWRRAVLHDLQSIKQYIATANNIAANNIIKKIILRIELLQQHPKVGCVCKLSNTRELIISGASYIIPYRIKNDCIEILRVFHSARKWLDAL